MVLQILINLGQQEHVFKRQLRWVHWIDIQTSTVQSPTLASSPSLNQY